MLSLYQSQIFLKLFFLIEQINIINRTLFNRARREFEYFHFLKDKEVLRRHGNCKLCDEHPHGMHADAIRKLYRFAEAKELVENVRTNELLLIFYSFISRKGESLYKDINNMAHDETQLEHGVLQIIFLPVFNHLPLLMRLHLSHLYIASRMVLELSTQNA